MTLYAIYNPDGSISQANKVYDPDGLGYDRLLNDRGLSFIKDTHATHLCSHDHFMVDIAAKNIKERPVMQAVAQASTIKAGTSAVILNIPNGAAVTIIAANAVISNITKLDGDELEFSIPVPCKYRTTIRLWPFKDSVIDIEAVA